MERGLHVDSILVFNPRSVSSEEHDLSSIVLPVCLESSLINGELIGGELREHEISHLFPERTLLLTVPVLSEQRMVTPANSSIAVIRVTIALYLASC